LDAGCKEHGLFYRDHKDTKERHTAGKALENTSNERLHASDASIREKIKAALVNDAMKTETLLGMGFKH